MDMPPAGKRRARLSHWVSRQHAGQLIRRTDEPYMNHLQKVAEMAAPYAENGYEAGLCHDLLEKTNSSPHTLFQALLQTGYAKMQAEEITAAVVELTNVYTKSDYPQLKKKVRKAMEEKRLLTVSPLAQTVKYADLYDNIQWMLTYEPVKTQKYLQRKKDLLEKMGFGNPVLRQQVLEFINKVK